MHTQSLNQSASPAQAQSCTQPPRQIRLRRIQKVLEIVWPDGLSVELSCLSLRMACACSHCTHQRRAGAISLLNADIGIERLELSGHSGLQFHFSDGHYRGLYPWKYLRELCEMAR